MTFKIDRAVLLILRQLQTASFQAYVVGGAVRDFILERPVLDFDITTNAKPEQILALFPTAFYENQFGTVSLTETHLQEQFGLTLPPFDYPQPLTRPDRIIDLANATKIHVSLQSPADQADSTAPTAQPSYQITTYRADEQYDDFRRPTSMTWGTTLSQDLERRDFTLNALALHLPVATIDQALESSSDRFINLPADAVQIIDEHGGQQDLTNGLLRTVGEPQARFQEDALRMLRAVRFSVQLNLQIEPATWAALTTQAELLQHISWERIRDEFLKMLSSDYPAEAIEILDETGLLTFILPELLATKGVEQGGHHTTDVWVHSIDALRHCPSPDPIVRLATLLHDIAKPQTQAFQNGTITFYNHEVIGARVASKVAKRLRLSTADTQRIFTLVRHHMFHYQPEQTDAAIRRFMRNVGLDAVDDILDVREGDRLGSGARKTSWRLEEMKQRMLDQLHQPLEIRDLAVNGHDLMTTFELQPGPILGQILHALFEQVLDNPELNTKDKLLDQARQYLQDKPTT